MRRITLGNAWEIVRDITEFSTSTGTQVAKSGLTLTGYLSQTKNGATINAALSKSLSEVASTGRYYAAIPASDVTAQLTSILGTNQRVVIYERLIGTDYQDYEPLELTAERQAGE